uniref:Uncharacterized protein n=1 Tax=Picea glauca TaxID=3330 RepID=A0A101M5L6_PICGL|nr:hypothetical protein ABT39_MTgene1206 [Picea glauca]
MWLVFPSPRTLLSDFFLGHSFLDRYINWAGREIIRNVTQRENYP